MKKPNKLISEQSPYLLQHAHNPVEWYPWSEEAFEKAKTENKPIFLSIGYSTCHWCHVMEKESFEDEEVAKLMNQTFVSIKVDREERPDIDNIYMTVCQMMTGSGGWPLTIVMTPEKKPFFAGTYFPKKSKYGRIGMLQLIPKLNEIWNQKQNDILATADEITNALINSTALSNGDLLSEDIFHKCFNELWRRYDEQHGGFGRAPKFPTPHLINFLLRYWKSFESEQALQMAEKTLSQMRLGGIYDHVGFGFHRYSTDQIWLVPHFEKMLYDQALLALAYTNAYQASKNNLFKKTTKEILAYVERDMKDPNGGFYSAEDADSEGEEGKFYLWSIDEIRNLLGDEAGLVIDLFNIKEDGNWIDQVHGHKAENNILSLKQSLEEYALKHNFELESFEKRISMALKILFDFRRNRIPPQKDDKILTDWNALMISAFAKAARVFGEKSYEETAESAASFILNQLTLPNGRLLHRFRNGKADILGNLDDYAFFIAALLDLYETTFSTSYLTSAIKFTDDMLKYFWDEKDGGFFFTAVDSEELLVRQKPLYDGAIPSGNSVALMNLARLFRFTCNNHYEDKASKLISAFSSSVSQNPSSYTEFVSSFNFFLGPTKEIILAGNDESETEKFLKIINEFFLPNSIVMLKRDGDDISEIAGFTKSYSMIDGKTTVYICENFNCNLPVTNENDLINKLRFDK